MTEQQPPPPWTDAAGLVHHVRGTSRADDDTPLVWTECGRTLPHTDHTPTDTEPCEGCCRDRA